VAVLCCAATVWAAQAGSPTGGSDALLPDLSPQSPGQLTVRAVQRDGRRRFRLGFRSAADNVGSGPLVVGARRDSRRQSILVTTQVVARADGSVERRPLPARLRYVHSAGHRLGRDHKTGFCLGDRYSTPSSRPVRGRGGPAAFDETDCGKGRPDLSILREGISVGYGDDYDAHLGGQEIDITGLLPGRYTSCTQSAPTAPSRSPPMRTTPHARSSASPATPAAGPPPSC
jgi:hypothetical protein